MKKTFITVLCVFLFVAVCSAWFSGDDKNEKAKVPEKIENTLKNTEATQKTTVVTCCSASCPMKTGDSKVCLEEKKPKTKAPAAASKEKAPTAMESKSSGKK